MRRHVAPSIDERSQSGHPTAHQRALIAWLDELDALDGGPSDTDYQIANALLDDVFGSAASS